MMSNVCSKCGNIVCTAKKKHKTMNYYLYSLEKTGENCGLADL